MPDGPTRPTIQRLRHAGGNAAHVVITDTDAAGNQISVVTVRLTDWLLDRLHHRAKPAISLDQYASGLRYFSDWYHSHPHSNVDFSRTIVDGAYSGLHESERMIVARFRFEKAMKALCGRHRQILNACLIEEQSLESFGHRIGYRDKKNASLVALACLRDALDVLVEHYRGRRVPR